MHLDRQTNKQTNITTYRPTKKIHADMQIDRLTDSTQIDKDTYIHTCIHAYIHTCMHTYIHTDRQTDRQAPSKPYYTFTALSYPAVIIKFGLYGQKDAERTELLGAVELST